VASCDDRLQSVLAQTLSDYAWIVLAWRHSHTTSAAILSLLSPSFVQAASMTDSSTISSSSRALWYLPTCQSGLDRRPIKKENFVRFVRFSTWSSQTRSVVYVGRFTRKTSSSAVAERPRALRVVRNFAKFQRWIMACPWNLGWGSFKIIDNGTIP